MATAIIRIETLETTQCNGTTLKLSEGFGTEYASLVQKQHSSISHPTFRLQLLQVPG